MPALDETKKKQFRTQANVCNLNKTAEPMHMNNPAQALFSAHIPDIYIFGRSKHNSKINAKLQLFSRTAAVAHCL